MFITALFFFFLKRFYLFVFRERGKEGERERSINVWLPHVPPTGDLAHNPGMGPDWKSNRHPSGLQASTPSIEPHQPGIIAALFIVAKIWK